MGSERPDLGWGGVTTPALAALFPGQGSQKVGMAFELYRASAAAKDVLDEAERTIPGLLDIMWQGPAEVLQLTVNQQPALVAAGAAAFAAYLEAGGDEPRFGAGHSLGEITAHVAARSLSLSDALKLVRHRGTYMQEAVPPGQGAMAAVLKTDRAHVERICLETEGIVEIANLNAPEQTVISGEAGAVAVASEQLASEGARVVALDVSAPFHCSLMRPAGERLADRLRGIRFREPSFDIVTNVTADILGSIEDAADLLEAQVTAPVRWVESIERLQALGAERFLEFGSGKVLCGLVKRILNNAEARAITDMKTLQEAL